MDNGLKYARAVCLLALAFTMFGFLSAEPADASDVDEDLAKSRGWIVAFRDDMGQYADLNAAQRSVGDAALDRIVERHQVYSVRFDGETTASDGVARLLADPSVAYIEPDLLYEWQFEPDDELFVDQEWAQTVRLPDAWGIATGYASTVIAVLDSGVRYDHPDLLGRLLPGYDFVNNDADPSDDVGHGTAVSGVAAAGGNDATGIAGAAMDAMIMPVKVGNRDGAPVSKIAQGIHYAVDHGASVINLSLGSETPSTTLLNAITYAYDRDVVVVAAAGNKPDRASFPASYSQTISVGATDTTGQDVASFSSRITPVDLSAPGVDVLSPYWDATIGNTWAWVSGTSYATPMVAGTAALMRSVNPTLTIEEIRSLLTGSVQANFQSDELGGGAGVLDASAAVRRALLPSFAGVWDPMDQPVTAGAASRTWLWGPNAFSVGVESYEQSRRGSRMVVYYDKGRMEINDPYAPRNESWYVTAGLLATELISGYMQVGDVQFELRSPSSGPVAGDPDDPNGPRYSTFTNLLRAPAIEEGAAIVATVDQAGTVGSNNDLASYGVVGADYIQETGHRVASVFQNYLNSEGLIRQGGSHVTGRLFNPTYYATGYPVTEAYWANVKVAGEQQDVLIQCFERRCLTYTPSNPAGWQVEMGNVGQHYYRWRFGEPPVGPHLDDPTAIALGW